MIAAVEEHSLGIGIKAACEALGVSRATVYRHQSQSQPPQGADNNGPSAPRPRQHPRALTEDERQAVLEQLHSDRFVDWSPAAVYATLLDDGTYLCSISTMYRILAGAREVRERRDQLRHPAYAKPELLATGPNQLWSWDITKLRGPRKWNYYHLYVVMDVFSRYVVGWVVAQRESGALAKRLIDESCDKQGITRGKLTLHSDRGPAMKSKAVSQLLADLGVTKSHSRPYTSNDNPYSEAQFKTLKYRPEFPDRFDSQLQALAFCRDFFEWYNNQHCHSGIGLMTPAVVHHGRDAEVWEQRRQVLQAAANTHPERFVHGNPQPPKLQEEVWINRPADDSGDAKREPKNEDPS